MILQRLRVEGWRCFVEPVDLNEFADGVNVIHGPNGVGKSTLMFALVRALFDGHRTSGAAVKLLRPWGRELSPSVLVQWRRDGVGYRLHKRFLSSPMSELSRLEEGAFVRLAEGDDADRRAREALGGSAPGRGLSDQRHWGFAQVLWAPQGALAVSDLSQTASQAIHSALGAQVSGSGGENIERKIQDAYHAVFTPTGRLRSGDRAPRAVQLEKDLADLRERRSAVQAQLEAYEQTSRRIEDLRHQRDQADREENQFGEEVRAARRRADQYQAAAADRKMQNQAARAAEEAHKRLSQVLENIDVARRELEDVQRRLTRLQQDEPAQVKQIEARRFEAEQAKAKLDGVRRDRPQVDAARRRAQLAERLDAARRQLAELDKLIESIEQVRREAERLRRQRSGLAAPDRTTLRRIGAAARARDEAQVRLDASLITVDILPEKNLDIDVLNAEETGRKTLAAGKPHQIQGSPELAFRLPGVAAIRATGPSESAEQLRRERSEASEKLRALTEGFGTSDLEQLQRLGEQAEQLEAQIAQADVRRDTLLAGDPEEAIRQRRVRTANTIDEILAEQPDWTTDRPAADQLALQADQTQREFIAAVERAEADRDKTNEALSLAIQKRAGYEEKRKSLERQQTTIGERLNGLTADGRDDAGRRADLDRTALQWNAAKALLAAADETLAQFAGDPLKEVETLQRQLEAVRRRASEASLDLGREEVRLQQLGAEAPYSTLAALDEKIQGAESALERQRRTYLAIRLLHETIVQCKRTAVEAVVGPVQKRATQILHRIAGGRLGDVQFNNSFLPQGVRPAASAEPIALTELSGGEQEQLHFAVRLALADVAFSDQRQLVVLDDAFTYTDTPRLARIMTILEEAAEKLQIVVLTCHPERYFALPDAKFFDLPKLIEAAC